MSIIQACGLTPRALKGTDLAAAPRAPGLPQRAA